MEAGKTWGLSYSPGQGQWGYMGRDDGVEPNSQQSISLVTSRVCNKREEGFKTTYTTLIMSLTCSKHS